MSDDHKRPVSQIAAGAATVCGGSFVTLTGGALLVGAAALSTSDGWLLAPWVGLAGLAFVSFGIALISSVFEKGGEWERHQQVKGGR